MILTVEEWKRIESSFREHAAKWASLHSGLYHLPNDDGDYANRMIRLAASAKSPDEFAAQWKKSIGLGAMDMAEELAEESRGFRKAARLIDEAMKYTKGELKYGKEFKIRTIKEETKYYDYIESKLPPRRALVIDHAFYAIYVAWKPEARIIVPDNRIQLLRSLALDESAFRVVTPRQFEELVAYVYECLGCKVELTQQSRDFGADVLAWHSGPLGSESLIAVQVKRYASYHKVGVKEIFELHGAVTHYHADLGHVVTSSNFTGPARRFATDNRYHLVGVQDFQKELLRLFGK